nr:hypothetical protein [Saccharothrix deserti]
MAASSSRRFIDLACASFHRCSSMANSVRTRAAMCSTNTSGRGTPSGLAFIVSSTRNTSK